MIQSYDKTIENIITILKNNYSSLGIPSDNIDVAGKKGADLCVATPFLNVYPIPGAKKGIHSPILRFDIIFVIGISSDDTHNSFAEAYNIANKLNALIIQYIPELTPIDNPIDILESYSDLFIISCTYQTDILFYD